MVDTNSIIEGTVKFRDGKKWKSRWCVMRKLSPVADCLHLQLYRDSKDRYKHGQTKASLSLQHFLGVESGFTLDKESNTIAIICQDVIVVLAFDTRERLIQWQVKISANLGDDQQFLILISTAPSKAKLPNGPARMHVQDHRFCITTGVPPRLSGCWDISHLRRYGIVEGRFCFEGGSRCGKGEGLYVLITDQGSEITQTLQLAAQGKLAARRRPVSRKMSALDSPRKQLHSRPDTRISDLSCIESFNNHTTGSCNHGVEMSRSLCSEEPCSCHHSHSHIQHQSNDDLSCSCHRTSSPYNWSTESHHHNNTDLDSNYGCGDTASVSEMHDMVHNETWASDTHGFASNRQGYQSSIERCMSCISKLGAPSMSRSSTATVSGTPCANGPLFNPAWTMENNPPTNPSNQQPNQTCQHRNSSGCDRMSLCSSHGSSSGNSEYSVPRHYIANADVTRNTSSPTPPSVPPKSPKSSHPHGLSLSNQTCQCPPNRPPKPNQLATNSPAKKKISKPPMPLPITTPLKPANPTCSCHVGAAVQENSHVGPYENYDVPKTPFPVESKNEQKLNPVQENYDTPRKIIECLASEHSSATLPPQTMSIRKPCGCILKYNKKPLIDPKTHEHTDQGPECLCRKITPTCWPGNWMTLPYCRRGSGMENTSLPLSQNAPEPQENSDKEAIYATVDKSKKTNRKMQEVKACDCHENGGNYANIEPLLPPRANKENVEPSTSSHDNYENIDFAHSLEYYENAKVLLQKAGITREEFDTLSKEAKRNPENLPYSVSSTGVKVCLKCGHACHKPSEASTHQIEMEISQDASSDKQDDYLMMEPSRLSDSTSLSPPSQIEPHPFPGYLPMSPIVNSNTLKSDKSEFLKQRVSRIVGEKSASNPSLVGPAVDRSRKRSDSDMRIPGSAMLMFHHSTNSPYNRKHLLDSSDSIDSCRKAAFLARKRSSSADSSRYVEDGDELENSLASQTTSPSSETLRKSSISSLTNNTNESTQIEHRLSSPCIHQETEACFNNDYCRKLSIDVNSNETEGEDNSSLTSDSLRTQVTTTQQQTVNIRRSSSVPCKSGQNRDSSSSNDSGVSTGSLKHRGADFVEFELPLTTAMSSRRHHHYTQRLMVAPTSCYHSSLPRRSKSSDPLRELTFRFEKIKIPAKSSSAEAEVPICSTKTLKGFNSPADGSMGPPYIDSRSTSSGTSDMSDYIETLSLSSHSSSDATDLRLIRQPTTTLRPRSGKEYHNIDRSVLVNHGSLLLDGKLQSGSRLHGSNTGVGASYANITPLLEKSESPSPGYMSGSSPGQDLPTPIAQPSETSEFTFQKKQ